jgi:hypothetical protein
MGASKKLMEEVILAYSAVMPVTTARFANVAFSNGSLLAGFIERLMKRQPLSARQMYAATSCRRMSRVSCVCWPVSWAAPAKSSSPSPRGPDDDLRRDRHRVPPRNGLRAR